MSGNNELKYTMSEVKKIAHKWLYLEDDTIIDVVIATHIANQIDTDPIWLLNIAPPSNAKTEILRAFEGHPNTYFLSSLTASTFISGKKVPKNSVKPSLLFRINDKTLILKDFTSILSMRHEHRQEIISQLREIHDGSFSKAFGTGDTISWRGHVGLIAACTPIYDKYYSVIGAMGDRFMLYRNKTQNVEKMGIQAQKMVGRELEMRKEFRESVHKFINQFENMKSIKIQKDETIMHQIVYLASFCAYARCPVERDSYTRNIQYQPEPEGTPRLTKQFTQLGTALAIIHGRNIINLHIYEILKRMGRDLIAVQRLKIIRYLWDERAFECVSKWRRTKEIATGVKMPVNTAMLILEDLMVISILNRDLENPDQERAAYLWQIREQVYNWIVKAEVFKSSIQDKTL